MLGLYWLKQRQDEFLPGRPSRAWCQEHSQLVELLRTHGVQSPCSISAYMHRCAQANREAAPEMGVLCPWEGRHALFLCSPLVVANERDRIASLCRDSASLGWRV